MVGKLHEQRSCGSDQGHGHHRGPAAGLPADAACGGTDGAEGELGRHENGVEAASGGAGECEDSRLVVDKRHLQTGRHQNGSDAKPHQIHERDHYDKARHDKADTDVTGVLASKAQPQWGKHHPAECHHAEEPRSPTVQPKPRALQQERENCPERTEAEENEALHQCGLAKFSAIAHDPKQ